ncbi:hypothetical protein [Sphingomonas colocasiae]|uniref:MaoC family dehydratase n=1 Tax=Sphingomonas colocasiae TaxID=1848973 RepID=A0ABS7PWA2_9SPHN|nr:hypothetical protein [Sphingomonas colocasiae]MBY8825642.1 hypothetical protein [Sphingomonas colocasiae]
MNATQDDIPPPPEVRGIVLDGAEPYVIKADENAALCRSTGIEPAGDGTAHPIYHFIATQLGMKHSVAEFCALFDFDVADGPMIVGSIVTFHTPLRVETPYWVRGEILSITRKQSRKLGTMDVADYRLALLDGETSVAEVTNSWIFPRKART